jgi:hypothetical protein
MKIVFEDKSYLDIAKTDDGSVCITIQAKDQTNPLKKITNSVKITKDQLDSLISSIK